ncbi:MAG TPA: NADPH-dependent FMN reductase, partial [Tepidiformaceae bacterium]|nr:NADPH-dependent FMN reductase [Tepidiformaceae bacterium]
MVRILAICGSPRSASSNMALLRTAAEAVSADAEFAFAEGIFELPHFNPDLDGEGANPSVRVASWRAMVDAADGVVISSPEYAHGVPGSLKNALDWLVSCPELPGKPVLLLNASAAGGNFAQAALAETLRTMSLQVL